MKKIWVHKADSFEEAEAFDARYYSKMTRQERLDAVQMLRDVYFKLHPDRRNAARKGLRRVIKVIPLSRKNKS